MEENLNLYEMKKLLVVVALNRYRKKSDVAKALGICNRHLFRFIIDMNIVYKIIRNEQGGPTRYYFILEEQQTRNNIIAGNVVTKQKLANIPL